MLVVLAMTESTAYAYIDPGTGSFLVQVLLATLLAVAASVRIFWQRIKDTWQRLLGRQDTRREQRE